MPNEMNHPARQSSTHLFQSRLPEAFRHRRRGDGMISVFVWTAGGLVLAACSGGRSSDMDAGGLPASVDDAGRIRVADQGSGYVDDNGDGLLAENASIRVEIGALSHEISSQVNFELTKDENDDFLEDNADFEISSGTLYYTGNASGDFETGNTLTVLITSTDENNENEITENYLIYLADADDLPMFGASSYRFMLAENTDGSGGAVAIGTVGASDEDTGDSLLTYRFADGEQSSGDFRIDASTGQISYAGSGVDFEGATTSFDLIVEAAPTGSGTGTLTATAAVTVTVTDADDAPTAMTLSASTASVAEGTTAARELAVITFTDDGLGMNTATVSDETRFEIRNGTQLWLKAGVDLDYETNTSHTVTVTASVTGSGSAPAAQVFTLNVTDVNDEAPGITSGGTGTAIVEETEASASMVAYTATGTYDVTPITWSLSGGGDFEIDASTGEVTLTEPIIPDHETQDSYTFTVRATSGSFTTNQEVTIAVTDVDEAPTGISLSSDRFAFSDTIIGTVTVTDPDAGENYTPANISLGGADKDVFEVVSDGNGGMVLGFESGQKAKKISYAITLMATDPDSGAQTAAIPFTIELRGVKVADEGTGYVDANGDGLLAENADGSSSRVEIGELSHQLSTQVNFELVDGANNNADFEISSGKLHYTGKDSGDFEKGDTLTVRITSTDENNENPLTELYVIYLSDVAITAPEITQESISVAAGTNTGNAIGTISATDKDGDSISYSLPVGVQDNGKFEIDSATGALKAKSGEISSYSSGDQYKVVVLASNDASVYPDTAEEKSEITDRPNLFVHGLIFTNTGSAIDPEDNTTYSISEIDFVTRQTLTANPPFVAVQANQGSPELNIASPSFKQLEVKLSELYDAVQNTKNHVGSGIADIPNLIQASYATDQDGNVVADPDYIFNFKDYPNVENLLFQDYAVLTIDVV
ncbi:cadherin domain-containing protein [Alphaproteobacteria bacterium LSUCC0684]